MFVCSRFMNERERHISYSYKQYSSDTVLCNCLGALDVKILINDTTTKGRKEFCRWYGPGEPSLLRHGELEKHKVLISKTDV